MNAPNHFHEALILGGRTDYLENMRELAANLLAGQHAPVGEYHSLDAWKSEAQYAVDTDDWSEFKRMLAVEDEYERYQDYSMRFPVSYDNSYHPPLSFEEWARP